MNKELKAWLQAFLLAVIFDAVFVGLYWLLYYCPALYDASLRVFGGSGEMSPPAMMWWKAVSVLLWGTLISRGIILWLELDEEQKKKSAVLVRLEKKGKFVYKGQEFTGRAVHGDLEEGTLSVRVLGDNFVSCYTIKAEDFEVEEET